MECNRKIKGKRTIGPSKLDRMLKLTAYPSIFPKLPSYMQTCPPKERSSRTSIEQRRESHHIASINKKANHFDDMRVKIRGGKNNMLLKMKLIRWILLQYGVFR